MTAFKSDFLRLVHERGYVHQVSDLAALDALAAKESITAYIGFDATADSLHVGSLVSIMLLRRLQQTGHKPIVLMGGGTTKIGDPSFRDEARPLLTDQQIDANIASIRTIFQQYLNFGEGPTDAVMVNNADWLDRLSYIPFLREVGRHFTINRMLTFDSVQLRLEREQPLTFLEFNYMILQAYDFLELARRQNCRLQMGGSDQWGNIINGVELGRRVEGKELFALTTPLITTAGGQKMGKTAAGAVWLNEARRSSYDFWQFWRNTDDADVGRFLKLFTDLSLDEIARLEKLGGAEINDAKKILANEATALARGRKAAEEAAETARRAFEEGESAEGLPTVAISKDRLKDGVALYELLREAGLAASNGEARRLIKGGGVKVNDQANDVEMAKIDSAALKDGTLKLSVGKKRHALIRAV